MAILAFFINSYSPWPYNTHTHTHTDELEGSPRSFLSLVNSNCIDTFSKAYNNQAQRLTTLTAVPGNSQAMDNPFKLFLVSLHINTPIN